MTSYLSFLGGVLLLMSELAYAQTSASDSLLSPLALKRLSLKELLDYEVVSVSKHPEKLHDVASAVQVITRKDIRNSGAKTLPEALRLANNLQVAQVNASQWAISARGFNNVLANKLLVLIDGRTVYTPLYAGVFWDVQNLLLEDIERIEVISGPGGTLWGANAVNGIINIITRHSKDTKGLFVEGAFGSNLPGLAGIRYGGHIKEKLSYRIYGTGYKLDNTIDTGKSKTNDRWGMWQAGFQADWDVSAKDKINLQQNIYRADPNPDGGDTSVLARGTNIVAKWDHIFSGKSIFQLQAYYDHTHRDFGNGFTEDLKTIDIDLHHRMQIGRRHELAYGFNVRLMDHLVTNLEMFAFFPANKRLYNYNIFVQDEITLIDDQLRLTIGTKAGNNNYTGFEYQPNIRLTYKPSNNHTIWGAVSRAVRTPARIDREFHLSLTPNLPIITGGNMNSENVIAYELGWRSQPLENLSLSLATFYNRYDDIRSVEPGPPPFNIPVTLANGVKGRSWGGEFSATWQVNDEWQLRGGYTVFDKRLFVKPNSMDMNKASAESNDPGYQFLLQSVVDFARKIEWGTVIRYIGKLPKPEVKAYMGLDIRIGWKITKVFEVSLVGQNLLNDQHLEFMPSRPREIRRGVYGKIICQL